MNYSGHDQKGAKPTASVDLQPFQIERYPIYIDVQLG